MTIRIIGGGLAGCEAAWQVARRGLDCVLYEMRPARPTPAHQTANNWINAAAFKDPNLDANGNPTPVARFGNEPARMTQIREGATKNLDFAVAKGFKMTERVSTQFRAEFLNALNHPQYGGEFYGSYYGSSNITNCLDCGYPFGQVLGTRNDPRNIQFSLKLMF